MRFLWIIGFFSGSAEADFRIGRVILAMFMGLSMRELMLDGNRGKKSGHLLPDNGWSLRIHQLMDEAI